jgi:hypothetical protein
MAISTIDQTGLNAPLTLTSPVLTTPNLGTPSAINLSNATALPSAALPTGCILQVVQGTYGGTSINSSSTTFIDAGLTATITPKFANSKILVTINQGGCGKTTNNTGLNYILLRNGTLIQRILDAGFYNSSANQVRFNVISAQYLDSPATTSAITYKTQFASYSNNATATVNDYGDNFITSTITLMEIAG